MKESAKSTFNPGPLQRTTPACTAGHFLLATSSGFRLAFPGSHFLFFLPLSFSTWDHVSSQAWNYMYVSTGLTTTGCSHHLFSLTRVFTDWCGRGGWGDPLFIMWNFLRSSKFPLSLAISQVWSFHHTTKVHAVTEWFRLQLIVVFETNPTRHHQN